MGDGRQRHNKGYRLEAAASGKEEPNSKDGKEQAERPIFSV